MRILKIQSVVVLSGCKCSKAAMSIGSNITQIFSHSGFSEQGVPFKDSIVERLAQL